MLFLDLNQHKERAMRVSFFDKKPFIGPTGRTLGYADFNLFAEMVETGMIACNQEEVPFHSGFKSRIYVEGRNDLSDNPHTLTRVALRIKDKVESLPLTHGSQKCVIGIPTAGTQLAHEISSLSRAEHSNHVRPSTEPVICFRTMRSVPKKHGKNGALIDPPNLEKHSYVTIENIVSSADSMLQSLRSMEVEGYPTRLMHQVVFATWGLGGINALQTNGYTNVHTLYHMQDVIAALALHLDIWPKAHYDYAVAKFGAHWK